MPRKRVVRVDKEKFASIETGEIVELSTYIVPPGTKAIFTDYKHGIPEKAKDPFFRVNYMNETENVLKGVPQDEKGMLLDLIHLVGWENNYIQKNGRYLNVSELALELGLSRSYVSKLLSKLEQRGFLFLRGNSRERTIYLNSKYVWKGNEKNRTNEL